MSTNPVVLITGGGRGIGAATAKLFAKHGYDVCINYKSDHASAEQVADEIIAHGVNAYLLQADIADEQQVLGMFARLDAQVSRLDVLVNNAAMMMPHPKERLIPSRLALRKRWRVKVFGLMG